MNVNSSRAFLLVSVIAACIAIFSGCKDDPATPPPTPPPVTPADTTPIHLTSTLPDTIFTTRGLYFSISFTIMKGTNPVDSAVIDFFDPIANKQIRLGPSGPSGGIVFYDTVPEYGIPFKVFHYVFTASKGSKVDSIERFVKVREVDPTPIILTIQSPIPDTTFVAHGGSVLFKFHVTHYGDPIDSAFVDFLDPLPSSLPTLVHFGPTIQKTGNLALLDYIGQDVPSGPYTISFIATRRSRLPSDTVKKVIMVVGSDSVVMGLRANSLGATSIGVKWTRLPSDKSTDTVIAMSGSTVVASALAPTGKSNVTLNGLTPGVIYSISVRTTTAFSETISWATATRFGPIRLYENSDPDASHPSGLVFASQATERIAASAAVPMSDLFLATDVSGDSLLTLAAVSVDSLSHRTDGKLTHFSDFPISAQSLDAVSFGGDLASRFSDGVNAYRVPPGQSYLIFQVQTSDQHYAQVQVVNQLDGSLVGKTAQGFHYVDLLVSYQPIANAPYAARGKALRGHETERFGRRK